VAADVTIVNVGDPGPHGHRLTEVIKGPADAVPIGIEGGSHVDHHHD